LKKCPNLKDSHGLPGVFCRKIDYEYKKLQNIFKNTKLIPGMPIGPGEVV
jgi:hypothetical protein